MHRKPSLLLRMKDPERQDLELRCQDQSLPIRAPLASRITRDPPILSRMRSPNSLQELPHHQTQNSIRIFSSNAMPSSKSIERGKFPKQPFTSKSNRSLSKHSETIGHVLTQPSELSSRPLRVMTPRLKEPIREDEFLIQDDDPPALLARMQMNSSRMENPSQRNRELMIQPTHGLQEGETDVSHCQTISPEPSNSSIYTQSTLKRRNAHSLTSPTVQSSLTRNGRMSSQEEQSASMPCLVDSSPPQTTISRSRNSEISKSLLERLNLPSLSKTEETGPFPGIELSEQSCSPSLTDFESLPSMENTLSIYSRSPTPASIAESSLLTKRSANELEVSETLNYPTSKSLPTSRSRTWIRSGYLSSQEKMGIRKENVGRIGRRKNLAITGTRGNAVKPKMIVDDNMSVTSAKRLDTREKIAESPERAPKRPRYLQHSVWADHRVPIPFSPTASCTLTDEPLPQPSPEEFQNSDAVTTIKNNPDLFRIITPIKVDRFEELLVSHPNKPFVESICTSLREGFWPWAHTQKDEYPITWDYSDRPPKNEHEAIFLRTQRDIEIEAQHYSRGFGTELLPGMYSTPIHAVPKPRSEKLRLVNDHSAGPFSLNSMIAREDIAGAKMDSITDLTEALLRYRRSHPNKKLVIFKSDVSAAYRRLPLHPLWQIKQIVTVDGVRHVDRCTSFGGRGSCRDYTSFMGLVLWIAIFVKFLEDLLGYIDDNFSFDEDGNVMWYEPYRCYFPTKQTKLLNLWDEIGVPHDRSKQEYAPVLRVIGFLVDPNLMRVSMDEEDRVNLIQHVADFTATARGGTRRTLREFQQIAGWINWSFNVFPLLKPALSNVYAKVSGKSDSYAKIYVSKAVVRDLDWFVSHVRASDGVYLFQEVDWALEDADVVAYADACMSGLGFFLERSKEGFQCMVPHDTPKDTIFYFEALAVVSVVEKITRLSPIPTRLLVFSDNTNTVNIFDSLRCLPPYNDLLKFSVSLLLKFNISLRVVHIAGINNVVADALSRYENTKAVAACPGLSISNFQPPRVTLGPEF